MNEFVEAVTKKYAQFTGRARRREYWMFILVYSLISLALTVIEELAGWSTDGGFTSWGPLSGLFTLTMLIPTLAISVRRLHDTGRSGWTQLLGCIPLVNLILIYFHIQDSQSGSNKWGPNPKGRTQPSPAPAQNW